MEEFFLIGLFDKVTVNMTSYTEPEDEQDREEEKQEDSLKGGDKALTVLEVLPTRIA